MPTYRTVIHFSVEGEIDCEFEAKGMVQALDEVKQMLKGKVSREFVRVFWETSSDFRLVSLEKGKGRLKQKVLTPAETEELTAEANGTVPMNDTHALHVGEQQKLREANCLLTRITYTHEPFCECELCEARALTDVQDKESFTICCALTKEEGRNGTHK